MTRSAVDYEDLIDTSFSDANQTVRSSLRPRWERKKQQQPTSSSSSELSAPSASKGDRFIPNRAGMKMEISQHLMRSSSFGRDEENEMPAEMRAIADSKKSSYTTTLSSTLLGVEDLSDNRVISYQEKAPVPKGDTVNNLNILYSATAAGPNAKKSNTKLVSRHIPTAPSRVLDAPELKDDYYLNLVSWSDTNIVAVALDQTVYLWNAASGDIQELCTFDQGPDAHISSVMWVQEGGGHLAVGVSSGMTQLWDVNQGKQLRSMDGHTDRVGALAWNRHILSTGSRDTNIVNHDVRVARHQVATLNSHSQEVCSLAWSQDGETLASGANDNMLCLWDATASGQRTRFTFTEHQAAVKALAWSPHERNLLASGAGTADRTIKFWNTRTGCLLNSIDTGSQVCALQWNPFEKEILSSHGFARNQLCLWKYPSMAKIKEFEGHASRVLHLAVSPDGGTVLSAGADETLRFWDIFAPPASTKRGAAGMADPFGARTHGGGGGITTKWTSQLR